MPDPSAPVPTEQYRLAPALAARLLGAALAAVGVLVCVVTALIALLNLPVWTLTVLVAVAIALVVVLGVVLTRRVVVLELREAGYRVRFVRGVGVAAARWQEVERLDTAQIAGDRCLVLRLRDGRTTTVPVAAVQGDPEELVRSVRARLRQTPHGR